MHIGTVVIPAAGLGTRFLPYTKCVPKELLPIFNKPVIHYIVEEGIIAGILHVCLVINESKKAIRDYFQENINLDAHLAQTKKSNSLQGLNSLIKKAQWHYVNQQQPLGLGHAILITKDIVGNNQFAVVLPDELIFCKKDNALEQLQSIMRAHEADAVIGVQAIQPELCSSYGIIRIRQHISPGIFAISDVVEKPLPGTAPSNYAIIGRYLFSPTIFHALENIQPHVNGELQLTDAINYLIHQGKKVYACVIEGDRHDTGQPAGWYQAIVSHATNNVW